MVCNCFLPCSQSVIELIDASQNLLRLASTSALGHQNVTIPQSVEAGVDYRVVRK